MNKYYERMVLAELGYTENAGDLEDWEIESFCLIASERSKLKEQAIKQAQKKAAKGR